MTTPICHICQHGEAFHDRWSICGISGCSPCYQNLQCPRCKHAFFEHSISDDRVMCTVRECNLLTCYDKRWPEKPLYTITPMATPGRLQQTYEESLAPHPLTPMLPITTIPAVATIIPSSDANDPEIEPGLWRQYKAGREYVTERGGYVAIDINEKNDKGAFKRHIPGRTWDTKYGGYMEDTPPGPPERGFLD